MLLYKKIIIFYNVLSLDNFPIESGIGPVRLLSEICLFSEKLKKKKRNFNKLYKFHLK